MDRAAAAHAPAAERGVPHAGGAGGHGARQQLEGRDHLPGRTRKHCTSQRPDRLNSPCSLGAPNPRTPLSPGLSAPEATQLAPRHPPRSRCERARLLLSELPASALAVAAAGAMAEAAACLEACEPSLLAATPLEQQSWPAESMNARPCRCCLQRPPHRHPAWMRARRWWRRAAAPSTRFPTLCWAAS